MTGYVQVLSREPDPMTLKFSVICNGYAEQLTLDRIKEYVAQGYRLTERPPCEQTR